MPSTLAGWTREVEGIERYLTRLRELELDNGPKWVRNTVRYYRRRLAYLRAHRPKF